MIRDEQIVREWALPGCEGPNDVDRMVGSACWRARAGKDGKTDHYAEPVCQLMLVSQGFTGVGDPRRASWQFNLSVERIDALIEALQEAKRWYTEDAGPFLARAKECRDGPK